MNTQKFAPPSVTDTFAERIRLLIQRVGSVTEIARMCGFSEGVVRSWRDGNTDPSRARCVTLARTLGISLVWLVAGEGTLQAGPGTSTSDDQYSSERTTPHQLPKRMGMSDPAASAGVDAQRLSAAVQILQSELNLAGSQLSLFDNTDLLSQLYEILGPGGSHVDPVAMVMFNHKLTERIQKARRTA